MDPQRLTVNSGRLTFEPDAHVYKLDGRRVPSVTQALALAENFEHVPPDVLEAARAFGSASHLAVDLFNRGRLDISSLDDPVKHVVDEYERFLRISGFSILGSEMKVASIKLRYAGTLDMIAKDPKGRVCVLDLKTGEIPKTVGAQTAAYERAFCEMTGSKSLFRYCLRIPREGPFSLTQLTDPSDFSTFCSFLNVWRFIND